MNRIATILREEDIEGFIEAGAPSDEYDSEAEEIFLALQRLQDASPTRDAISAIISLIWQTRFNLSSEDMQKRLPNIVHVSDRILNSHG